jgi:hypothetical protein
VVNEIGLVVLQLGCGEEVVIRMDPPPVADVGLTKEPFSVITAETPGDAVTVVES